MNSLDRDSPAGSRVDALPPRWNIEASPLQLVGARAELERWFGFKGFRPQPADAAGNPLQQTIVEAALTVGGGGWGAENVGDRKEYSGKQDDLILHGTITEAIRGAVGLVDKDGFLKYYYFDSRVLEGILPGDIWMQGKFIPAPAGWHDYRPVSSD